MKQDRYYGIKLVNECVDKVLLFVIQEKCGTMANVDANAKKI